MGDPRSRAAAFYDRLGIRVPIFLAPMAGTCPPSSSIAVMRAGGFGACAALLMRRTESGSCRCRRDHRARNGGWWTSRRVRCEESGTGACRIDGAGARDRRRGAYSRRRCWWNCGWPRCGCSADLRRECSGNRHRIFALSRNEVASDMGRRVGENDTRANGFEPRIHGQTRSQRRHRLCARGAGSECTSSDALPGPARSNDTDAARSAENWRCSTHASVGWSIPPRLRGRNLLPSLQSERGVRRRRSCLRPFLIGVSLLRQSQTCCSSFSSARSGRKYIIAGNAIMTRASGV